MAFTFGRESKISSWLRDRPRPFLGWEKTEGVLAPELYHEYKHDKGTPMLLEQVTPRNLSHAIKEINIFERYELTPEPSVDKENHFAIVRAHSSAIHVDGLETFNEGLRKNKPDNNYYLIYKEVFNGSKQTAV